MVEGQQTELAWTGRTESARRVELITTGGNKRKKKKGNADKKNATMKCSGSNGKVAQKSREGGELR